MTTTIDIDAALLDLARVLGFKCKECGGSGVVGSDRDLGGSGVTNSACLNCDHGMVWVLREPCRWPPIANEPLPYHCNRCQGRGWYPSVLGPNTIIAAAAKCGITFTQFEIRKHSIIAYGMDGQDASAPQNYNPTDAASITLAQIKALLEVV